MNRSNLWNAPKPKKVKPKSIITRTEPEDETYEDPDKVVEGPDKVKVGQNAVKRDQGVVKEDPERIKEVWFAGDHGGKQARTGPGR